MAFYRNLILIALVLAFAVMSLGTYARLSDAGLGCTGWPDCYGKPTPHLAVSASKGERVVHRDGSASSPKAWTDAAHRYLAGALGGLLLLIAVQGWRRRREIRCGFGLPLILLGLIVLQALLGTGLAMKLLKPLIVSAHLLGSMAILSLLFWLWLRERTQFSHAYFARVDHLRGVAMIGLFLVIAQIALGGWVSTNYAALACTDFPQCQGQWVPVMDFANGFALHRDLGETASGAVLPTAALTAIHWTHRLVALVMMLYLGRLVLRLMRSPGYIDMGLMVGGALLLQVALGAGNVFLSLPLAWAVAHSAGAVLLLFSMVLLNYRIRRR